MKKTVFLFIVTVLVSIPVLAQRGVPTFAQYRVRAEKITPKAVNLASHKNARMYRTNLRNAAREGVNFAGHFILTTWGCGTNCNEGAIIDARTGRVFFPKELEGFSIGQGKWSYDLEVIDFKPNSTLIAINGYSGGYLNRDNAAEGIYFYQWTGTAFKKAGFVKKDRN
jgi:hypothetical protein